jgi:DNA invertase Pin-like site-specific DNA recombinase
MLFQMCGVFAEFERAIISERVRAGLERVRANGQESHWTASQYRSSACQARKADAAEGMGLLKIGRRLGIGTSLVQRLAAEPRT